MRHFAFALLTAAAIPFATMASASAQEPRFVPDPEGTLDTQTGLIWGFTLYYTGEYLRDIGVHDGGGAGYTWGGAMAMLLNCNADGTGFCTYPEFSEWHSGTSRDDWRLPTKDELVAAAQAGLFLEYDRSPHEGVQLLIQGEDWPWYWSSTAERVRGSDKAYSVHVWKGDVNLVGQGSVSPAIAVRGVPAPVEDNKPGNGNGPRK